MDHALASGNPNLRGRGKLPQTSQCLRTRQLCLKRDPSLLGKIELIQTEEGSVSSGSSSLRDTLQEPQTKGHVRRVSGSEIQEVLSH